MPLLFSMIKKKKTPIPASKIAIIGAGAVGSTAAYVATIKNLASEIILIDRSDDVEDGHAMDISDGLCFVETACVKGADYTDARDADIIVITAGAAQKKGETRLELVDKNINILKSIFKGIGKLKSSAIVIIVSNPVDVLTYVAQEISGLPESQVFGSGTTLDTARLKTELGHKFGVSPLNVSGFVMGEHGDSEFIPWSTVSVGGIPITKMKGFTADAAKKIETRVRQEAYEIINKKGATYYGIAAVIADIIQAVLYNQKAVLPVTARLSRWNGVSNVCLGAPAVIGRSGIEKHWPVELTTQEKKRLANSAKTIKSYL